MASAGRILIMPKGNYDSSATYEMLDMVHYNGTSWLAKKTVSNIEPSAANNEYWHNLVDISRETIGAFGTEGGILTGNVSIVNEWPTLFLKDNTNRNVTFSKNKDHVCSLYNYLDDGNHNVLMLSPETSPVEDSVMLLNVVGGTTNLYKIFGEHNLDLLNQYIDARIAEKMN